MIFFQEKKLLISESIDINFPLKKLRESMKNELNQNPKLFKKRFGQLCSEIISGVVAEIIMVSGYYVFEGFMYGFIPSAVNVPANSIQGIAGLIMGVLLIKFFRKIKYD